jgi:hypothetical protein
MLKLNSSLFFVYLKIFIILSIVQNHTFANSEFIDNKWDGWKVNADAGIFSVLKIINTTDKIRVGPCLELGLEYGKSFGNKKQYYAGVNTAFNAFIPDSFKKLNFTILNDNISKAYPILIPIIEDFRREQHEEVIDQDFRNMFAPKRLKL